MVEVYNLQIDSGLWPCSINITVEADFSPFLIF